MSPSFGPSMLELEQEILKNTTAEAITAIEEVQTLWSGYGQIRRVYLIGGLYSRVIVKHVQLPKQSKHPRGWNTSTSHFRKLKSYQVEGTWYKHFAEKTTPDCKVPQIYHIMEAENEILLIMEDLDESGYQLRLDQDTVTLDDAKKCLKWLANFHAQFMGNDERGLWPIGTYWHLDTRSDELEKMENIPLKQAAKAIDERLRKAKFQTLVHGDAKLANFCFSDSEKVAAVDFQYVGQGCGIKDVAYFISSCFDDSECETYETELLNHYFNELESAMGNYGDFQEIKKEWSELYGYAWADFYRFLDGWSPGHWKMHGYSERLTQVVLCEINS